LHDHGIEGDARGCGKRLFGMQRRRRRIGELPLGASRASRSWRHRSPFRGQVAGCTSRCGCSARRRAPPGRSSEPTWRARPAGARRVACAIRRHGQLPGWACSPAFQPCLASGPGRRGPHDRTARSCDRKRRTRSSSGSASSVPSRQGMEERYAAPSTSPGSSSTWWW
jgi:hypothetical protein